MTPSLTPVVPPIAQSRRRLRRGHDRGDVGVRRAGTTCRSAPARSRTPRRTVPLALLIGITALVADLPVGQPRLHAGAAARRDPGVERIAEKAVNALVGAGGARIVAATVVVSTLGCNAAVVIAMSRACYAMAADGMFFKRGRCRASPLSHAACRDRDDVRVVRPADADRHLRAALHLGHLRVGDVRRARRSPRSSSCGG